MAIRNRQDFGGGLMLLAVAGAIAWSASDLAFGNIAAMGPGFLPMILAVVLAGFGAVLTFRGMTIAGPGLEFSRLGGISLILLSLACFAMLIEDVGLFLTAFGVVLIGSLADPDRRWIRNLLFALGLAALATALFGLLLSLPIPLWPAF